MNYIRVIEIDAVAIHPKQFGGCGGDLKPVQLCCVNGDQFTLWWTSVKSNTSLDFYKCDKCGEIVAA